MKKASPMKRAKVSKGKAKKASPMKKAAPINMRKRIAMYGM